MNWEIILTLTGIMLFAYWLNYIMGSPLAAKPDDVDPKAILFEFPYFLAIRRLKEYGVYLEYQNKLVEELAVTKDKINQEKAIVDSKLDKMLAGRELFTWERALLCAVCSHWWFSVIVGIIFVSFDLLNARADFLQAALTYLVLHLIIRKIS